MVRLSYVCMFILVEVVVVNKVRRFNCLMQDEHTRTINIRMHVHTYSHVLLFPVV